MLRGGNFKSNGIKKIHTYSFCIYQLQKKINLGFRKIMKEIVFHTYTLCVSAFVSIITFMYKYHENNLQNSLLSALAVCELFLRID